MNAEARRKIGWEGVEMLGAVPVLAYHAVGLDCGSRRAVCLRRFRAHIDLLVRKGYAGLTLSDAERLLTIGSLPKRAVVITFDDGFASILRTVPTLEHAGFPATVFVVSKHVDSGTVPDWPLVAEVSGDEPDDAKLLSWAQLRSLARRGWEIGSHGVTHAYLSALDDDGLVRELTVSRARITAECGACDVLAYPYGVADERVILAARAAGYRSACMLASVYERDEPLARCRIGIGPRDGAARFRLKLSPSLVRVRRTKSAHVAQLFRARLGRRAFVDERLLLTEFAPRDSLRP